MTENAQKKTDLPLDVFIEQNRQKREAFSIKREVYRLKQETRDYRT